MCAGYSYIFSSDGELVAKAEPFQETLITYSIPLETLHQKKKVRLFGNPELFEIVKDTYEQSIKSQ